jgi:hypothetical protein
MSATQLTLDGREIAHPPPRFSKKRTYVVLRQTDVLGASVFVYVGTYDTSRPTTAIRRARREHKVEGAFVAVPSRYWNVR